MTRAESLRRLINRGLRATRLDHAIDLLRAGKVSTGKAAELAGVSIRDMLDEMQRRMVPSGYTRKDLDHDVRELGLAPGRSD